MPDSVAISEAIRLFGLDRRPLFRQGEDQRMGFGKGRWKR
ncbi:hypothetical protein ABIC08_009345 [Bradyrhizobium sp. RT9b]